MKTIKLAVNGNKQNLQNYTGEVHPMLELKESILVKNAQRGGLARNEMELQTETLVELVYDDATVWLCPSDSLEDIYPGSLTINRDGETVFELPTDLDNPNPERGPIGAIALKLFNSFTRKKVSVSIQDLAQDLEQKQMGKFSGLVQVGSNFELKKPEGINTATPCILFIHGTNSSAAGSFAELVGTDLWSHMLQTYGSNILAFQHETLTKSPLQNAVDLMNQLPPNINLHIITHSRGGLVGEVLCRFSGAQGIDIGFTKQEINLLQEEGRDADIKAIKQLQSMYPTKNFLVKKFIRVACPSSGTTILSKRLDYFFNISLNLLGAIPALAASPLYAAMKSLLIAIIDQKNDVDVLPGLEAMKPDSPFITIINNQSSTVSIGEPVVAVSGNCQMKLNLKALVIIASKLFFFEDNDLIVNTKSMYNGSKRKEKLQYFFDEGTDVDHFHYFKNRKTNAAILLALKFNGTGSIDGFTEHFRGTVGIAERNAILGLDGGQFATGEPSGKKPIVVLLPGIMGSSLTKDDDLFWINYLRFLSGGLTKLSIDEDKILAPSIIKTSYKNLGDALQGAYDVVTFPFDWRKSLEQAADEFDKKITALLKWNKPIKIIGHSMGGVLVRDFMVYHPATWKKLNESENFRLIFLGSPLGGSFRINNVLFGEDDIISKISKVDIIHSKRRLLSMFTQFPGLLCLLPFNTDPENDFSNLALWDKMKTAFGDKKWPLPSATDLTNFGRYRDKVLSSKTIDYTNAVYIAGQDKQTPCGYRIDQTIRGQELIFLSTAEGDQSVTWESGIPKPMIAANTVYYVNHSHGALSNAPPIFNGIKEILQTGQTNLLSKIRPSVRGGEIVFKRVPVSDFDLSPEGLENTLLGITTEEKVVSNELPVKITVSNGDLKYADYPLLAGHFKNDSVLYAEERIDRLMNGLLKQQHKLGVYPGDVGTYELMLTHDPEGFPGTIIVGMGEPDKLTSFELARSIEQGTVKYLLFVNGQDKFKNPITIKEPLGISSLIIGCGYGGLTIENSVNSILQGIINANAKIKSLYNEEGKTIEHVEFIEIYQDRSLSCMYALRRMSKEFGGALNVTPNGNKINMITGARRNLNIDMGSEWWNRITITSEENKKGQVKGMRFSISTGAAREDLRTIFTCTGVVEKLIESISTNNNWTDEKARAVFELLIPNDFKGRLKKHGNITWVLDNYTARFPWELLQDNSTGAKPLCINAGMIRQLLTVNSRINIEPVTENVALVVGDPDLKGYLTQLPGALEEAKTVAELLKQEGFEIKALLRESQETIVPALVSNNYKIIHLAGHGIYSSDPEMPSGMVIGENNFLSTAEINQMSTTPELVFVNCCFLGKAEGVAEEFYQSRFKLAANIGTQLINNGVKAVIVAGWAVDDSMALQFAKTFYENMFAGKTFGEAVRFARETIYTTTSKKNTWGAYQCYGDPFYKLRERIWKMGKKNYIVAEQAEIDLYNLRSDLDTGEVKIETAIEKLKTILDEVKKQDIRTQAITELEGSLYKAMHNYEKAITIFEDLRSSPKAGYSLAVIEQLCNLRIKRLKTRLETEEPSKEIEQEFDDVLSDLEALIHLNASSERYSLTGSAWKRKLIFYKKNKTKTVDAIKKAAANYYTAFTVSENEENIYNFTNWVALKNLLVIAGKDSWDPKNNNAAKLGDKKTWSWQMVEEMLKELELNLTKTGVSNDFWDRIKIPNIKLCSWLLAAGKDTKIKTMPDSRKVLDSYKAVWKMAGTKDEKETELQHLSLIIEALKVIAPKHPLLDAVIELSDKLSAAI